ncbi:MAG: hypothetical protein ABI672_10015 [Vicinamibacteria bacterium]
MASLEGEIGQPEEGSQEGQILPDRYSGLYRISNIVGELMRFSNDFFAMGGTNLGDQLEMVALLFGPTISGLDV